MDEKKLLWVLVSFLATLDARIRLLESWYYQANNKTPGQHKDKLTSEMLEKGHYVRGQVAQALTWLKDAPDSEVLSLEEMVLKMMGYLDEGGDPMN